jgi:hypothetical protein
VQNINIKYTRPQQNRLFLLPLIVAAIAQVVLRAGVFAAAAACAVASVVVATAAGVGVAVIVGVAVGVGVAAVAVTTATVGASVAHSSSLWTSRVGGRLMTRRVVVAAANTITVTVAEVCASVVAETAGKRHGMRGHGAAAYFICGVVRVEVAILRAR